jgi:hypothetical protein
MMFRSAWTWCDDSGLPVVATGAADGYGGESDVDALEALGGLVPLSSPELKLRWQDCWLEVHSW